MLKRSISMLFILILSLIIAGCGEPSAEEKKTELQKSSEAITAQLNRLDEINAFWKQTWTEISTNKINRAEGKKRMDFIYDKAMEVSVNLDKIKAPSWMKKESADNFNNMVNNFGMAAYSLANGAKNADPLLTKDKPSQYEMDTVLNNGKEYQGFILKGAAGFAGFKTENNLK